VTILTVIILSSILFSQDYPELGSSESLDFMTWNVQNYPKHNQTNSYMEDIISQINVDIIAFQEIESSSSFNNLINQLGGDWVGYRTGGNSSYGELAYAINTQEIEILNIYTILSQDAYYFAYREPYVLRFNYQGNEYIMINNHFKCCGDGDLDQNNSSDEEYRRLISSQLLQEYVEDNYSNDSVIILGDLNDIISDSMSDNVFWGFLQSDDFEFADYNIAYGSSSHWSYPTWPSHLDHIIITDELFPDFESSNVQTFEIDNYFNGGWNSYDNYVSDHRPVFMRFDFEIQSVGDLNSDQNIDILDVVIVISLILAGEYDIFGDVNYDGTLNVMDAVILVNSILN
jgi:exonuclease III